MGRITSTVDDEIVDRIDQRAEAGGRSRSEWIADAVLQALDRTDPELRQARIRVEEEAASLREERDLLREDRDRVAKSLAGLEERVRALTLAGEGQRNRITDLEEEVARRDRRIADLEEGIRGQELAIRDLQGEKARAEAVAEERKRQAALIDGYYQTSVREKQEILEIVRLLPAAQMGGPEEEKNPSWWQFWKKKD
ncbi:MAG: ribbon-helix-helix protein, CopG family [Candidatus Methanomethylophilaceae archaeon]|jgi:metal-responsive CopG/Arc/MetJ family transcriptional regulator